MKCRIPFAQRADIKDDVLKFSALDEITRIFCWSSRDKEQEITRPRDQHEPKLRHGRYNLNDKSNQGYEEDAAEKSNEKKYYKAGLIQFLIITAGRRKLN